MTAGNEVIDMGDNVAHGDPLYLFACHLEWHRKGNLAAYQELLRALNDTDEEIRIVAESLLERTSPRAPQEDIKAETW